MIFILFLSFNFKQDIVWTWYANPGLSLYMNTQQVGSLLVLLTCIWFKSWLEH